MFFSLSQNVRYFCHWLNLIVFDAYCLQAFYFSIFFQFFHPLLFSAIPILYITCYSFKPEIFAIFDFLLNLNVEKIYI